MLIKAAESKDTACSRHVPRAPNHARCLQQPILHALVPVRNDITPSQTISYDRAAGVKTGRQASTDAARKRHPRGGCSPHVSQGGVCSAKDRRHA